MNQNKKLLTLAFFLLLPFTFNMVSCSCENSSISPPTPPLPPPGTSDFPTEALNANDDPDLTHMTPGENPVVALKSDGNPVVAWVEKKLAEGMDPETHKIYCWSWNGRTWDHLPADSASARQGFNAGDGVFSLNSLNLKITSDNLPVIAWQEQDASNHTPTTYIKKWNGSAWVNYGSSPELNARTDLGSMQG